MKKYFIVLVCALFTFATLSGEALALTGFGFGPATGDTPGGSERAAAPKDARVSITGTVKKTFAGLVINAVGGQYIMYGKDLASMVGKRVTVTGEASQLRGRKRIFVTSFEEVN